MTTFTDALNSLTTADLENWKAIKEALAARKLELEKEKTLVFPLIMGPRLLQHELITLGCVRCEGDLNAGKSPREMYESMRRRHASGSRRDIVEPSSSIMTVIRGVAQGCGIMCQGSTVVRMRLCATGGANMPAEAVSILMDDSVRASGAPHK